MQKQVVSIVSDLQVGWLGQKSYSNYPGDFCQLGVSLSKIGGFLTEKAPRNL